MHIHTHLHTYIHTNTQTNAHTHKYLQTHTHTHTVLDEATLGVEDVEDYISIYALRRREDDKLKFIRQSLQKLLTMRPVVLRVCACERAILCVRACEGVVLCVCACERVVLCVCAYMCMRERERKRGGRRDVHVFTVCVCVRACVGHVCMYLTVFIHVHTYIVYIHNTYIRTC